MEKVCKKCNETKSLDLFPTRKDAKDGHGYSCKVCDLDRKKKYTWSPDQFRNYRLKKRYGITLEEYNVILESQNHCCAICNVHIDDYETQVKGKSKFTQRPNGQNLSVDHNHETGEIRGLLCYVCNLMLGNAKDSIELLEKAIDYLKKNP